MADDIKFVIGVDDRDLIKAQKEQLKFQRNLITIEKAFRKGDISAKRYNSELAKQAKQLQTLGGSYNKANSEVRKYAYSLRQANDAQLDQAQAMAFAGKKINRMGVGLQQAGYQIGDFAVQIQGGTNAAVALGQQGSQLLGIFGPAGAIAGAGLAIATAFIAPLLKAKDSVKELEDQTIKSIGSIEQTLRASRLGVSEEELAFIDKLSVAQDKYTTTLENFNSERAFLVGGDFSAKEMEELLLSDKQAMEQARLEASEASAEYEKFKASRTALLAGASLDAFGGEGDPAYSPEGLARARAFQELLKKTRASMGQVAAEATTLSQEVADAAIELGLGYEEALKLQEEMKKAEGYALGITKADMESGILAAAAQAQILAKNMGISLGLALDLVALAGKSQAENLFDTKVRTGIIPPQAAGDFNLEGGSDTPLALQTYMDSVDRKVKERQRAAKKSSGGGGKNVVDINEIIEARKKQAEQERVLIGLSGEQEVAQRTYFDLLKQNEKADIKLTDTELKGAADAIAAYEEQNRVLEEAVQIQEDIATSIANNFGDAFMSIVDGTKTAKEAFKDMARAIIKDLFRILVVEQMVKSVKGFFNFADGGAFSGGSQIQAYADGGVVGGPTFFPMAGGKTGLMGEAGPEAIMPLKRGANGKLGVQADGASQGNVVVNQSFNFQANGDDSVKKLIAQAAPQIANMTQKQIMDSRKRGGSMKAAFG